MESFFLPVGARQLCCSYHPPARDRLRPQAILLCSPIGRAKQRSQLGWSALAASLAAAGHPCLSFDYTGTGDASGDESDWDFATWTADLRAAAGELEAGSGAAAVVPLGLGLGANLAMLAPEDGRDWEALVAWNPIRSGREHLRELEALDARWRREKQLPPADRVERAAGEWLGHPHSALLRAQIADLELERALPRARRWLLLRNAPAAAEPDRATAAVPPSRTLRLEPAEGWSAHGALFEAGADPRPVLDAVVAWLAEVAA